MTTKNTQNTQDSPDLVSNPEADKTSAVPVQMACKVIKRFIWTDVAEFAPGAIVDLPQAVAQDQEKKGNVKIVG